MTSQRVSQALLNSASCRTIQTRGSLPTSVQKRRMCLFVLRSARESLSLVYWLRV